jgi:electron transport complex protein RnfB
MMSLAGVLGGILSFAYSRLKVEENPLKDKLVGLLPGVNCGACGAASCADFADKLLKGEADISKCRISFRDSKKAAEINKLLSEKVKS